MKVVVAVIMDDKQSILIAQRPFDVHQGGLWEFPGGKIEANESAEMALTRELYEELGIRVEQFHFLGETIYQYPSQFVHLFIYQVTKFSGFPHCREKQLNLCWVNQEHLHTFSFPKANQAIFSLINANYA